MKLIRIAVAAVFALGFSSAYAFHSGGVAECDGCHTMHNSAEGAPMADWVAGGAGPYLLQGNTASEACLNCHQHAGDTQPSSYHISTAVGDMDSAGDNANTLAVPRQMTPGGDFGWIRADVPFAVRGTPDTNFGRDRGHNIVAPYYGYSADPVITAAPGGTYPAANLACSSCHDPHGKYRTVDGTKLYTGQTNTGAPIAQSGSYGAPYKVGGYANGVYRLLGGVGYAPKSYSSVPFTAAAPAALVPSSYNRAETGATAGTLSQTVATYGMGMSEYCANCHPAMLMNGYTSGMPGLKHPAGNDAHFPASYVTNYKSYVKSGDVTGTGTGYWSLVPFETGSEDRATLLGTTGNGVAGPDAGGNGVTPNVSCLSCHRAHASGFKAMIRFAHENEFMTIADTATGAPVYDTSTAEGKINRGFVSATAQAKQYYGRTADVFAGYQRLLCNKCHVKD